MCMSARRLSVVAICLTLGLWLGQGGVSVVAAAHAEEPQADLTYFYRQPSPERVARIVAAFNASGSAEKPNAGLVGFLAAVFLKYPDAIGRMIPAGLDPRVQAMVAAALWLGGQHARATEVLDDLRRSGNEAPNLVDFPAGLDAVRAQGAEQFDLLWGASFATGDPRYCAKILEQYARVANEDGNAEDLVAIVRARATNADLRWLAAKRGSAKFVELAVASSALWSLRSNALQHEFVRAMVDAYVKAHPGEPAAKALTQH
jgi:hypothetical protein